MTEATATNGPTLSWASLNLNEVTAEPMERSEVPAGTYTFKLVGAKLSPFENQKGATDIDLVITEGAQAKRHVFTSIPTPDKGKWVAQAASNLIKQLGGSHNPGEELYETLNRIAQNGANPVTADIEENQYTDKVTGELKTGRPRVRLFSFQAVS